MRDRVAAPGVRSFLFAAGACLVLATQLSACASAVESSKTEDKVRRAVPVAICLKPLARHGTSGVISTLTPEDYWTMVLPTYDAGTATVDRAAPDCAGRQLLSSRDLLQADGPRTGPIRASAENVVVSPGPDGFKVVWLRTHRFSDGTAAGPIALVRPREAYAEVYATGLYRGSEGRSRFGFERLGPDVLVTATDEGCTGVKANQNCETAFVGYVMSGGELWPSARFALDRIQYGHTAGIAGAVQYRLTATPVFQDRGIRLTEQVVVRDASQTELRKSDLERLFALQERVKLVPSAPSLWEQVMAGVQQTKAYVPPPPSSPFGMPPSPPPSGGSSPSPPAASPLGIPPPPPAPTFGMPPPPPAPTFGMPPPPPAPTFNTPPAPRPPTLR